MTQIKTAVKTTCLNFKAILKGLNTWESHKPVTLFNNTALVTTPTFHQGCGNATHDIPDIQHLSLFM